MDSFVLERILRPTDLTRILLVTKHALRNVVLPVQMKREGKQREKEVKIKKNSREQQAATVMTTRLSISYYYYFLNVYNLNC